MAMELPALPRSKGHFKPILSLLVLAITIAIASTITNAAAQAPLASPLASPAPAPAPSYVNITQVLVAAGDFSTFVKLLIQTKVGEKFQTQANQTQTGITIFAPKDKAFNTAPASTLLKNLTDQQMMSLLEYHALNNWQPLAALQQTSQNVTNTFATFNGGGKYQFNITDDMGTVEIITDWNKATITSTLYNTVPCSIFALDEVLLPEDLFGLPAPAPAPSPFSGSPSPSSSSSTLTTPTSGPSSNSSFAPPPFTPSLFSLLFTSFLFFKLLLLL